MSKSLEIRAEILDLREELEFRHKTGLYKMAKEDGQAISTKELQDKLYKLIYKLSKL